MTVTFDLNPEIEEGLLAQARERGISLGEYLQEDCTPPRLAEAVATLIRDERVRAAHLSGYDEAMRLLGAGGPSPSLNAADRILAIIAACRQRQE